jgi:hypothetical protein
LILFTRPILYIETKPLRKIYSLTRNGSVYYAAPRLPILRHPHYRLGKPVVTYLSCELCRVWKCINDLIVNVALEALYIHEEGRSDRVIDS